MKKTILQKIIDNFIYFEITLMIISALSSFFTFYQYFSERNNNIVFGIVTIIVSLFIIILAVKHIYHLRDSYNRIMSKTSDCFHKLNHNLRDTFFDTKRLNETNILTIDYLTEKFISKVKDCVNYLSDTLSSLTGKEVNVCIKVFEPTKNGNPYDENNAYISTLCRSSNSQSTRTNKDKISKVIDNTDFSIILFEGASEFYQVDLNEYLKNNEYRNSNKLWKKQYKCTIVVPIRIGNKFLNGGDDNMYDIMGFVCVDSNSIDTFTNYNILYYVDIVKSFSDALYKYFKQYEVFISQLKVTV